MKLIFSIMRHTLVSTWRFRLVQVLGVGLLVLIGVIPSLIKHNGTAAAFAQVYLTYTLGTIAAVLGFVTLWLACGTLAREIEECQLQMVSVKPVARWQIWLGKWLGIMALNGMLLALAGGVVYCLLMRSADDLSPRERALLEREILVARNALHESPTDYTAATDRLLRRRLEENPEARAQAGLLRRAVAREVRAMDELVPPDHRRTWEIELGERRRFLRGTPMTLRVKFHAARSSPTGAYPVVWFAGPKTGRPAWRGAPELTSDRSHEIQLPPNLFGPDGTLAIWADNRSETTLLFPLEDGLEVLYRESGFGVNYLRALLVMFCGLAVVAALGLMAASFLSFPVAAFFCLSLILLYLSTNLLQEVVWEGTIGDTGHGHRTGAQPTAIQVADRILLPVFRAVVGIKESLITVSPVEALSTGRSITWGAVAGMGVKFIVGLGGLLAAAGTFLFYRRELAAVSGSG